MTFSPWASRIIAAHAAAEIIFDVLRSLGPGIEHLLWESGLEFVQVPAGAAFASLGSDFPAEERRMLAEIDLRHSHVQAAFSHSTGRIFLRDASALVLTHELAHAVDASLNWYGSLALSLPAKHSRQTHGRVSAYAATDDRERFAESFAAYLGAARPRFSIQHLYRTDRRAAAIVRSIFRAANGSAYETAVRPLPRRSFPQFAPTILA